MAVSESIEFNGITFRRYPNARQRTHRVYFSPAANHRRRGVGSLHQEIWKAANGPIPDGHVIHHVDEDPLNNSLGNLECVPHREHHGKHWSEERARKSRERLALLRPLAAAWHSSPDGIEWHRRNAARFGFGSARPEPVEKKCDACGERFLDATKRQHGRFCSNACKSAWRRKSKVDHEERACARCGAAFRVNRYQTTRYCSRRCSSAAHGERLRLQSDR